MLSIGCRAPIETFFHGSKQFLNLLILMPFSASAIFCFTSFTLAKRFPLRTFFIWGDEKQTKKVTRDEIWWMGRVRPRGHAVFGQKLPTLSMMWAGELVSHPSWNGQTCWKRLQKKFTEAERSLSQHHQWCTDTDGFLEHSPGGGSLYYKGPALQKIIPVFWGVPSYLNQLVQCC